MAAAGQQAQQAKATTSAGAAFIIGTAKPKDASDDARIGLMGAIETRVAFQLPRASGAHSDYCAESHVQRLPNNIVVDDVLHATPHWHHG